MERKKIGKIWLRTSWYNQSENAVPFVIGNTQNFKPEYLLEWKAPKIFNHSIGKVYNCAKKSGYCVIGCVDT